MKGPACLLAGAAAALLGGAASLPAQDLFAYHGDPIPAQVEAMYVRGLQYLAATQSDAGGWGAHYGMEPGVVGLCVLAMLAHGEDPNFGPYSGAIRKGLDFILKSANPSNGYLGRTMYNHGFSTLTLAEAYGAVDDPRIGPALKKAVGLILTSQAANPLGGWRYSPESRDADTTVSGAQMVALFAARNAGLHVPDEAIKKGLKYYRNCQSPDGGFGYTSAGGSNDARSAIGALVFALAKEKDDKPFKAAFHYLQQAGYRQSSYPYYYLYYAAQAFFHGDMETWRGWNETNLKMLANAQNPDGSWTGNHGPAFTTAAALLSVAVNYRLVPIYER